MPKSRRKMRCNGQQSFQRRRTTAQSLHDPVPQTRLVSPARCRPLALTPRGKEPPGFRTAASAIREPDPRVSSVNSPSACIRLRSSREQKPEDQKPFLCIATTKLRTAFKELQQAPVMSTDVRSKELTKPDPRSGMRSRACNEGAIHEGAPPFLFLIFL